MIDHDSPTEFNPDGWGKRFHTNPQLALPHSCRATRKQVPSNSLLSRKPGIALSKLQELPRGVPESSSQSWSRVAGCDTLWCPVRPDGDVPSQGRNAFG